MGKESNESDKTWLKILDVGWFINLSLNDGFTRNVRSYHKAAMCSGFKIEDSEANEMLLKKSLV